MKGLLLKDFYVAKKHCRFLFLMIFAFTLLSLLNADNLFLIFYPCMLTALLPTTLLGYDERNKWDCYCAVLPCTDAQIVSAKYLIGLMCQLPVLLLIGILHGIKLLRGGVFQIDSYVNLMALLVTIGFLAPCLSLPFIFKVGPEKGRIVNYVVIGLFCCGAMILSQLSQEQAPLRVRNLPLLTAAVSLLLYALSWYLSILFYRNREHT